VGGKKGTAILVQQSRFIDLGCQEPDEGGSGEKRISATAPWPATASMSRSKCIFLTTVCRHAILSVAATLCMCRVCCGSHLQPSTGYIMQIPSIAAASRLMENTRHVRHATVHHHIHNSGL